MADSLSTNKERLSPSGIEAQPSAPAAGVEAVDTKLEGLGEIAEIIGEAPSETQASGKNKASGGTPTQQGTAQTQVAVKSIKIPTLEVMRVQIATEVNKQIKKLEKEANLMMMNPNDFSPFKMNALISKIRELKDILSNLAFATVESLKGWWMRFVKNN